MSQLMPFVRAFRALAVAFDHRVEIVVPAEGDKWPEAQQAATVILHQVGEAFAAAATDLEQQIAQDLAHVGRRNEVFDIPSSGHTSPERS